MEKSFQVPASGASGDELTVTHSDTIVDEEKKGIRLKSWQLELLFPLGNRRSGLGPMQGRRWK